MNRNALTLLGCSSSLVLMAIVSNPTKAIMASDYARASGSKSARQTIANPASLDGTPQVSSNTTNEQIKQLSLRTFGCTCANCISATRQMLQQGQLSL